MAWSPDVVSEWGQKKQLENVTYKSHNEAFRYLVSCTNFFFTYKLNSKLRA
jgi:hypothetical protein